MRKILMNYVCLDATLHRPLSSAPCNFSSHLQPQCMRSHPNATKCTLSGHNATWTLPHQPSTNATEYTFWMLPHHMPFRHVCNLQCKSCTAPRTLVLYHMLQLSSLLAPTPPIHFATLRTIIAHRSCNLLHRSLYMLSQVAHVRPFCNWCEMCVHLIDSMSHDASFKQTSTMSCMYFCKCAVFFSTHRRRRPGRFCNHGRFGATRHAPVFVLTTMQVQEVEDVR